MISLHGGIGNELLQLLASVNISFRQIFPTYYFSSQCRANTDTIFAKIKAKHAAMKSLDGNGPEPH
jgi:hypothetical protein